MIDDPSRVEPGSVAPMLVFAWGNPSRGDDALGPLFAQAVEALRLSGVECLTDFQLQVEHALDLRGRRCVLFVDAATGLRPGEPFRVSRLGPRRDASLTTHAVSPEMLLQVFLDLDRRAPPPAWLLRIGGERWELGEALSGTAAGHLEHALAWGVRWLGDRGEASDASGESRAGRGEARIGKPGPLPGGRVSGLT